MTLLKIQNIVINTSYVAAIKLDNQTVSGEKSVFVPLATPQFYCSSGIPLLKIFTITNGLNSLVKQLLHSKTILPVLTTSSTVPILYFGFWILDFLVRPPLIVGGTNLKDARNDARLLANANLKSKIG